MFFSTSPSQSFSFSFGDAFGEETMESSIFLSFLVTLLIIFPISSSTGTSNKIRDKWSRLSNFRAEKLIADLNLFPKTEVNIVDGNTTHSSVNAGGEKKVVERPFRFPGIADSGVSVEDLGHHAGYYRIRNSYSARMFYFFFESRGNKTDPVVIWLTGGPGCSSEMALFYENGPFSISDDLSLVWNDYGWDKASNLLYIDQPIGTGFSYTYDRRDIRTNEGDISDDLYDFLQAFFSEHPEFAKNDFFITGESYAGHYIPALAARVHKGNKDKEGIQINLKGFAMGNGLTEPSIQYKAYADYAWNMGLISDYVYDRLDSMVPLCEREIRRCGTDGTYSCMRAYYACSPIFTNLLAYLGNINYYDVRKSCEGSMCYDFSNMEYFLNKRSVREALGVGDLEFVSCSNTVYNAMMMDWMRNLEVGIPALLEDGIQMLAYAGEYDLICNWLGNSRWIHAMKWSGQKEFESSNFTSFSVDGSEAGSLKTYGPLSLLKVYDAGHMVPMDQPKAALAMLKRWTEGKLS